MARQEARRPKRIPPLFKWARNCAASSLSLAQLMSCPQDLEGLFDPGRRSRPGPGLTTSLAARVLRVASCPVQLSSRDASGPRSLHSSRCCYQNPREFQRMQAWHPQAGAKSLVQRRRPDDRQAGAKSLVQRRRPDDCPRSRPLRSCVARRRCWCPCWWRLPWRRIPAEP